ncbi:MAG: cellulase family glycosylhydrolase [Cyanobacteria bacterium P01_A01_bin.84]
MLPFPTPLSTRGTQIVDANGDSVILKGVNWFGMETDVHIPHGLAFRDYKNMLAQIKSLGFNLIRLPFSVNALRSSYIGWVNYSIGSNRDLQGKRPVEAMDILIEEAEKQGLFILLDSHRLNDDRIPELWYGDGFIEADWINTWTMLAQRYKYRKNIIGADLKNEPHGRARWGNNDQSTDWRLAAQRCGNAILSINPNWLIIVEGVGNVPGQKLSGHWWGGNLENAGSYPIVLNLPNKVIYSPHEYGEGVHPASWFYESSFPNNLYERWEEGFHYIVKQGIAPILIGEFGGFKVDANSKEGIWQRQFVDFIAENQLSFIYWSWNPNSSDTGGVLLDDWKSVDKPKLQLLNKILIQDRPTTPATPTPEPTPQPTPEPTPEPDLQVEVEVVILSEWSNGFCLDFQITNNSNTNISEWEITFEVNEAQIYNSWNGTFVSQGSTYKVSAEKDWTKVIPAGSTLKGIGYCANKVGSDYKPSQIKFGLK